MDDRMDALEARIARIEQALISRAMLTTPSVLEPRAPEPEAQAAPPRRSAGDAERFLGGRILLAVGALALLLGVSFFLKYAFDNGWIGPSGRVALGLVAGAAFLVGSARVRSLSQPVFAHGLGALGAGILYLSLWAAGNGFHLVPTPASFAGMCAVTALLVLLATRNDSQLMAIWGLIGGFLTPALNAGPQPSVVTLFAYLALLDAALVFVIEKRAWKIIAPVALVFTELYYFLSVGHNGNHVLRDVGFAALYLALFMSGPARRALQGKPLDRSNVTVTILSAIAFYAALHLQFYDSERMLLVAAIVALAAAYVFLAVKTQDVARTLFAALALALVTGGIAIAFHGSTVAALWAIEGALLVWTGARAKLQLVQFFGILAFAMALLDVSFIPLAGGRLFANDRFWTLAIFAGSFAAARLAGTRFDAMHDMSRAVLYRMAEVAAHLCLIGAFSQEFWQWSHGNELALTLFWLLYGVALLVAGFARNARFMRIEALALLGVAVLKAFLVDMSEVDQGVRIISFLVLGTALLGASYLYLRARQSTAGANE